MDKNLIEFDALKTKVLKYILYKKRTEQEIRKKFSNLDENLLEDVIDYLKEAGYINDNDYIKRAVNEFMNLRTLSIKELIYKLYSKGLNRENIEIYVENNIDILENYEKESAKKIFIKKQGAMEENDIITFLKKKGYTEDSIKYAMEKDN